GGLRAGGGGDLPAGRPSEVRRRDPQRPLRGGRDVVVVVLLPGDGEAGGGAGACGVRAAPGRFRAGGAHGGAADRAGGAGAGDDVSRRRTGGRSGRDGPGRLQSSERMAPKITPEWSLSTALSRRRCMMERWMERAGARASGSTSKLPF